LLACLLAGLIDWLIAYFCYIIMRYFESLRHFANQCPTCKITNCG
jgi:hypothetical protein